MGVHSQVQPIQVSITLPWAENSDSFELLLGSESILVSSAAVQYDSARCHARRILVGIGTFEVEISPEGAEVFVGRVVDNSGTLARFRKGQVTLRLTREWKHGDLRNLGGSSWDVILPMAAPEGNLQLQAMPYEGFSSRGAVGARLWPCSLLVAAYIRRLYAYNPEQLRARLLELGSGSGLCGLVAAAHGATVVLSDGDARVLPLLQRNVAEYARRAGAPRPHVLRVDFANTADVEAVLEQFDRFDFVIASDVLYEHRLVSPFFRAATKLLRTSEALEKSIPTILVAVELRPCGVDLAVAIQEEGQRHGFAVSDVTGQLRMWVLTPPDELQVPPLEERHRLYVVSVQPATLEPEQAARLRPYQPWQVEGKEEWYSRSLEYWSQQEASCCGVLGGHPETSHLDLEGSAAFLNMLQTKNFDTALDCGAGIGRITEGLLLRRCTIVDLLEPCRQLLEEARGRLGGHSNKSYGSARHFLELSLQDTGELPDRYDLIWVQWVLLYLTDADVVETLQRLRRSLSPCGLLVVKENCLLNNSPGLVDQRDASITRSGRCMRDLFAQAGLKLVAEETQKDWPMNLLPVMMFALR
ncbi:Alpha N-terminal protein methyltransferase 1 [Symbiodinium microadriaticum]|uniref:Alpha N-terminal protein methyltransferase 1 n=1 Tax=Symbiodinium microadriaticum TaxID=2951 RepID=A0A1Q9DAU4_SYMMI|nr:Alpha N-terminal protein methyltransferase 1 [Symbiodinium microadriaticum]